MTSQNANKVSPDVECFSERNLLEEGATTAVAIMWVLFVIHSLISVSQVRL